MEKEQLKQKMKRLYLIMVICVPIVGVMRIFELNVLAYFPFVVGVTSGIMVLNLQRKIKKYHT
ncbi:hypothetical protein RZN22_10290 [Bacillaceae bacterium S4-13-58]